MNQASPVTEWHLAQINVGRLVAPRSDAEALFDFVYRSAHTPVMARRREYFERFEGAYQALWWVPAGHVPSIDEGLSRLWRLDRYGSTPEAFTFKARFPAPGLPGRPIDMQPDPWCLGQA